MDEDGDRRPFGGDASHRLDGFDWGRFVTVFILVADRHGVLRINHAMIISSSLRWDGDDVLFIFIGTRERALDIRSTVWLMGRSDVYMLTKRAQKDAKREADFCRDNQRCHHQQRMVSTNDKASTTSTMLPLEPLPHHFCSLLVNSRSVIRLSYMIYQPLITPRSLSNLPPSGY